MSDTDKRDAENHNAEKRNAEKRNAKFPLRLAELNAPVRVTRSPVVNAPVAPTAPAPKLQATAAAARAVLRPQRLVERAHADAHSPVSRTPSPSGIGLDSADVRKRMSQRLRQSGIRNEAVLTAMSTVPRHLFVDPALVTQAYEDTSLPIGHGQTISKPSVVARMIELLLDGTSARRLGGLGRTLEIGTGCGYQAAVLSHVARHVISIERLRPLHDKARELLGPMRPSHLRLVYGDGMLGHAPNAPYDSIVAAAGGDSLPPLWLDQLAVGGRLVSPIRQAGTDRQVLMVVDRTEHGFEQHAFEAVHFVPLKSGLMA